MLAARARDREIPEGGTQRDPEITGKRRRWRLEVGLQWLGLPISAESRAGASRSMYITIGRENFHARLPISVV